MPEPSGLADGFAWLDATSSRERGPRRLARANWILTLAIVGTIATVAGVVIAYLTLVMPG